MPSPMEVTIISRETIKPSSPTPHHLRAFKLSLLDQLVPCCYTQVLLFYLIDGFHGQSIETSHISTRLKDSLSETLTHFYPLAGSIGDDELQIDCNDEGVPYFEARVDCNLSEFLQEPELELLNQFFPCDPLNTPPMAKLHLAMIQVNIFNRGGIAIGVCLSHKIADGVSISAFLKAWAAIARGCFEEYRSFEAKSLFPQNESLPQDYSMVLGKCLIRTGKCVTKRVVFDASAIAALKAKASVDCTRVEVVSAFIWKRAMAAAKQKLGFQRSSILTHAVNLRKKTIPSLPESSIGNLFWIAITEGRVDDEAELDLLVDKTRKAISKISCDFAKKLQGEEGFAVAFEHVKEVKAAFEEDGVDFYGFSSWCKFEVYEGDFGWGRPIWVSSFSGKGSVYKNLIFFMDTRCGNGIEAWVTLDEEELGILECDPEFLSFGSMDPSPLKLAHFGQV